MKSSADILKIVGARIRKTVWRLGLRAFWLILLIIFVEVIFGGFVFYKYVFLAERVEPTSSEIVVKFNEKIYKSVTENPQIKGQVVQEAPVVK